MYRYVIRRVLASIPTIIIISVLISGLIRLQPGDVIMSKLDEGGSFSDEQLQAMRVELGLDRSWPHQYQCWAVGGLLNFVPGLPECEGGGLIRGDFGQSLEDGRDVLSLSLTRFSGQFV